MLQVALLRNYTNGLTALVASLKTALTLKTSAGSGGNKGTGGGGWHPHQQVRMQLQLQYWVTVAMRHSVVDTGRLGLPAEADLDISRLHAGVGTAGCSVVSAYHA